MLLVLSEGQESQLSHIPLDPCKVTEYVLNDLLGGSCFPELSVAFLGVGAADNETGFLGALGSHSKSQRSSITVKAVAFLDCITTTATLSSVQSATSQVELSAAIVFTFASLQTWIEQQVERAPDVPILVLGMNAGLTFETHDELYDYHRFMCACARLSRRGHLANKEYVNFLGARNHVHGDQVHHVGGDVWCYRAGWWDTATDVICKSYRLLVSPNSTYSLIHTKHQETLILPQLQRQEVQEAVGSALPGQGNSGEGDSAHDEGCENRGKCPQCIQYLKYLKPGTKTSVVFVSASASGDKQLDTLLCNLCALGEAIHGTAFLVKPSVFAIRRIQAYCNTLDPTTPRPFICFTFSAMQAWIENHAKRTVGIPLLVLGPRVSLVSDSPEGLYECHAFLCRCAVWSRAGVIANGEFLGASWWDAAKGVISCTASARLFLGDQTGEH